MPQNAPSKPRNFVTPEEQEARSLVVRTIIERLQRSYADFISQPGYDKIPGFFRDHLYSPPNKDARDAALDKLYTKIKSVTGPEMTEYINGLIKLVKLTDDLDLQTGRALLKGPLKGVKNFSEITLNDEQLEDAMAMAGRFDDRRSQIIMVADSLSFFFALSKLPLIKLVMAPIKVAASLVGAMDLVSTMQAGYELSRDIKDMKPFVDAFKERETATIDALEKRVKASGAVF